MPGQHYEYDAFISYTHKDAEMAEKIRDYLQKHGAEGTIKVFLDDEEISHGENIVDRINKALSSARFFLLLLSQESVDAEWPTAERDAALFCDPSGRAGRIIPVIVGDCEIPPLLRMRKWADLRRDENFHKNMIKIVSRIMDKSPSHGAENDVKINRRKMVPPALAGPYSHEPDAIDEELYTNLYEVKKLPRILSAPTPYSSRHEIGKTLRCKSPTCVISSGMMYTSSDINDMENTLRQAVDTGDITDVATDFWLANDNNKRLLMELLNLQAHHFCAKLGLTYDETGKRYYGDMIRVTDQNIDWLPNIRTGHRKLILQHKKDGETNFYRHRSIKLSFHIFGNKIFLQVDPGWTFTSDGSAVIDDRARRAVLNTRVQSLIRNDAQFSEQRFWAWLLSRGGSIRLGESNNPVTISLTPLRLTSRVGIYGDYRPVSFDSSDPPPLVRDDGGDTAFGGGDAS